MFFWINFKNYITLITYFTWSTNNKIITKSTIRTMGRSWSKNLPFFEISYWIYLFCLCPIFFVFLLSMLHEILDLFQVLKPHFQIPIWTWKEIRPLKSRLNFLAPFPHTPNPYSNKKKERKEESPKKEKDKKEFE